MSKQQRADLADFPNPFINTKTGDATNFKPAKIQLNNNCSFAVEAEPVISSAYRPCATISQLADNINTVREDQKHYLNIRYINPTYTLWITVDALPEEHPVPAAIKRISPAKGQNDCSFKPAVIIWANGRSQPLIGCQVRNTTPEDLDRVHLARLAREHSDATRRDADAGQTPAKTEPKGVRIVDDFKSVVIDGHTLDLSSKHKARAVLRFLHQELRDKPDKSFLVDNMRERFNARFEKTNPGKCWRCERLREDLFKGVPAADFDRLFEAIDRPNQRYRLLL